MKLIKSFTMAEILISLTIIGVIAAITLPALKASINESTWNTKRKALYTRISQAISMMGSLGGYGLGNTDAETNTNAAMAFVTEGLNKVLKINNICDKNNLSKCGIPNSFTNMTNSKINNFPTNLGSLNAAFSAQNGLQNNINTDAVAFETVNGESVAVFYNPLCKKASGEVYHTFQEGTKPFMCANFIYDLNGKKGPNKVGKDIGFITALYPTEPSVVAPMPLTTDAKNNDSDTMKYEFAAAACEAQDSNSRLPNIDELMAMNYNTTLIGGMVQNWYWSGSIASPNLVWNGSHMVWLGHIGLTRGLYFSALYSLHVRCIKR